MKKKNKEQIAAEAETTARAIAVIKPQFIQRNESAGQN